eukprot:2188559-Pleurochrysis_carterae.AAC.6
MAWVRVQELLRCKLRSFRGTSAHTSVYTELKRISYTKPPSIRTYCAAKRQDGTVAKKALLRQSRAEMHTKDLMDKDGV